jgi:hypothetical protein
MVHHIHLQSQQQIQLELAHLLSHQIVLHQQFQQLFHRHQQDWQLPLETLKLQLHF